ncbi:MAG TPA: hypothetical protein VFJ82_02445 [Longimicrobium sp.]|nr:hypothetical protein [Longimicrobium sp.]
MKLDDLVSLIPRTGEREQFLDLGRRYYAARTAAGAGREASAGDEAALDELMEQVRWHLRAARHPIPARDELERMVREHFAGPA